MSSDGTASAISFRRAEDYREKFADGAFLAVNEATGICRLDFFSQRPSLPSGQQLQDGVNVIESQSEEVLIHTTCILPISAVSGLRQVLETAQRPEGEAT